MSNIIPTPTSGTINIAPQTMATAIGGKLINPAPATNDDNQLLNRQTLQELVHEIDPTEHLDEDVEELFLQIADDFIENIVSSACLMSKHRKSTTLEAKDLQYVLERKWNIWVPGYGSEELQPYKKSNLTEGHKQRMALVRKTMKKF